MKAINTMVMTGDTPPDRRVCDAGAMVHAAMHVHVPVLNARATIDMAFQVPAGSNREDCAEIAYERALMMLDPE